MTEELGDARARRSCVAAWARIRTRDTERDVHRVAKKLKAKLDIVVSS